MAPQASTNPELSLQHSLHNIRTLLTTFRQALQSPLPTSSSDPSSPNPLALLSDASSLLKAQTTKLSLLLLNKPFSPKEVTYILNTLSKSVLPALMSALELVPPEKYTRLLHGHVKTSLGIMWREMERLLGSISENGKAGVGDRVEERDALASTGVLWEQCDGLVRLGETGVVGLVDAKVKGYGELLEDAIGELEDWDPDGDDSEGEHTDETDDMESVDGVVCTPTTSEDEVLEQGMRKLDLSTQAVLKARVLKRLRLIRLLYPALRKRRIATFPNTTRKAAGTKCPSAEQVEKLDILGMHTKLFSDEADELVGAVYADDREGVERRLQQVVDMAKECVESTRRNWSGQEDEFNAWAMKWTDRLKQLEKT